MSMSSYSQPVIEPAETVGAPTALYSPTQAACGAALGGPVGVAYFLWANFQALGDLRAARKTIWFGLFGLFAVVVLALVLPPEFPSFPFTFGYILIARIICTSQQMTKEAIEASSTYQFHSNWRVFWLGILCLLPSMAFVVGGVLIADTLGFDGY